MTNIICGPGTNSSSGSIVAAVGPRVLEKPFPGEVNLLHEASSSEWHKGWTAVNAI